MSMRTSVWELRNWRSIPMIENVRHGIRVRIDNSVDPEVRRACKQFAIWLRKNYYFPIRVPIYIKSTEFLVASDGERISALFFEPFEKSVEPYIKIAVGDYPYLCEMWGKDDALGSILGSIAHELTHYFQWINDVVLTENGYEQQATYYSKKIVWEYSTNKDHP